MSCKYWLLLGSLGLGAVQSVGCSAPFRTCETNRTCPRGGAAGMSGAAGDGVGGGKAGTDAGGTGGHDTHDADAGEAGANNEAGSGGMAGDASGGMAGDAGLEMDLEIAQPNLAAGKTYVPFTGKISASGAAHYNWTITSGVLPAGLALQGAKSATATIAGTPTQAGQFPISVSVTDGSTTESLDVTLVVTHPALFLSDRNIAGVNELFVAEIGGASAAAPVQLSANLPAGGGVTSYAWSPDGSKVMYVAKQSAGGTSELWVAALASPGAAQRVTEPGINVSAMVWLLAGNVAAYSTSVGDTYLADLSAEAPGSSKFAISGHGTSAALVASPNGRSLGVSVNNASIHAEEISYVTWTAADPTVVPLFKAQGEGPKFSMDGRYASITHQSDAFVFDLSLPAPIGNNIPSASGVAISWSPNTQALFIGRAAGPQCDFSRGDFTASGLTITPLANGTACGFMLGWSPDGMNGLYASATGVQGISNLPSAVAGTDFSLLPSGFLSNTFTDTPSIGWSPDSKWVAFRADRDVDARYDLQLVRWSAPGVLYRPHVNSNASGVTKWAFAQNSQSIAFVGSIAPQNDAGLYLTKLPATGAPPTATLVSTPTKSVVQTDINWLPGSRVLTYRAVLSGAPQLFALPVAADGTAGPPISISGASGSGVASYQLAPSY